MKRWTLVFAIAFVMVILLCPFTPQAASTTTAATRVAPPQSGGILKVIQKANSNVFGYPPRMVGAARNYAPPFFDHLMSVGEDGKYKPGLALSWDISPRTGKPSRLSSDQALHSMTVRLSMPRPLKPTWIILFYPKDLSSPALLLSMSLMITL
jgi:hypothetical protein